MTLAQALLVNEHFVPQGCQFVRGRHDKLRHGQRKETRRERPVMARCPRSQPGHATAVQTGGSVRASSSSWLASGTVVVLLSLLPPNLIRLDGHL
ncbi:hypothetical protein ACFXBB_37865 [Streptomyces scopuliridis]|uniref:hypothetical protein n=1 Tax=Streptomyces scopuliridis TaxID=452529 RepID=UPI0036940D02